MPCHHDFWSVYCVHNLHNLHFSDTCSSKTNGEKVYHARMCIGYKKNRDKMQIGYKIDLDDSWL